MSNFNLKNNKLLLAILLLPLLEPSGISDMSQYLGGIWATIDSVFSLLKYLSFICTVLLIVSDIPRYKPSAMVIFVSCYELWYVVACTLNGNVTATTYSVALSAVAISLICDYYMNTGKATDFFTIISCILVVFVLINFLTIVMFPDGIYTDSRSWGHNFFLGNKNRHLYYYIPCLAFSAVNNFLKKREVGLSYYLLAFIITVSSVLGQSSTAAISSILFLILVTFYQNKSLPRFINITSLFLIMTVISFIFASTNFQSIFSGIIEFLFSKDSTFSSRTIIWDQALFYIANNLFTGVGNVDFKVSYLTVSQAQNNFIDMLVVGGIPLFSIYLVMMISANRKVGSCTSNRIRNVIILAFLSYFLLFLMEARRVDIMAFSVYTLAYNLPNIVDSPPDRQNVKSRLFKVGFGKYKITW